MTHSRRGFLSTSVTKKANDLKRKQVEIVFEKAKNEFELLLSFALCLA
jgi:hypothetical protein